MPYYDDEDETSEVTPELEAEFKEVFDKVHPEIQAKLKEAARLINEACALSDEHGVPFHPNERLTFIRPSYVPRSFRDKFPAIANDWDLTISITNAFGSDDGWQYSQTC